MSSESSGEGSGGRLGLIARNSIYIYIGSTIVSAGGFIFWIVAAKLVPSEAVGVASTIASLAMVTGFLASLGLNFSILRLGAIYRESLPRMLSTALLVQVGLATTLSLVALPLYARVLGSEMLALMVLPLAVASAIPATMVSAVVVAGMARRAPQAQVLGVAARLGPGLGIVAMLRSVEAIIASYIIGIGATIVAFLALGVARLVSKPRGATRLARELVRAGLPVWLPNAFMVVGVQLGVVFAYAARGGSEAGYLYLAQAIAIAIDGAQVAVATALIPALASGETGQEGLGRVVRIVYGLLLPVNAALMFFPEAVLGLIGSEYLAGSEALRLYAASNLIMIPVGIAVAHIYSSGRYNYTLAIYGAMSLVRVVLYALLAPRYGVEGVAAAFLAGSVAAFATALPTVGSFNAGWARLLVATVTVFTAGLAARWLGLAGLAGIPGLAGAAVYVSLALAVIAVQGVVKLGELVAIARIARAALGGFRQ